MKEKTMNNKIMRIVLFVLFTFLMLSSITVYAIDGNTLETVGVEKETGAYQTESHENTVFLEDISSSMQKTFSREVENMQVNREKFSLYRTFETSGKTNLYGELNQAFEESDSVSVITDLWDTVNEPLQNWSGKDLRIYLPFNSSDEEARKHVENVVYNYIQPYLQDSFIKVIYLDNPEGEILVQSETALQLEEKQKQEEEERRKQEEEKRKQEEELKKQEEEEKRLQDEEVKRKQEEKSTEQEEEVSKPMTLSDFFEGLASALWEMICLIANAFWILLCAIFYIFRVILAIIAMILIAIFLLGLILLLIESILDCIAKFIKENPIIQAILSIIASGLIVSAGFLTAVAVSYIIIKLVLYIIEAIITWKYWGELLILIFAIICLMILMAYALIFVISIISAIIFVSETIKNNILPTNNNYKYKERLKNKSKSLWEITKLVFSLYVIRMVISLLRSDAIIIDNTKLYSIDYFAILRRFAPMLKGKVIIGFNLAENAYESRLENHMHHSRIIRINEKHILEAIKIADSRGLRKVTVISQVPIKSLIERTEFNFVSKVTAISNTAVKTYRK